MIVKTKPHHINGRGLHHDLPEGMVRPGMVQKFRNLTRSLGVVAYETMHGRPITVPQEIYDQRLAICRTCSVFDNSRQLCTICGCAAARKLHLSASVCPWKENNRNSPKWGMWPPAVT